MARLDRRIQLRRAAVSDDGYRTAPRWNAADPEADNLGSPVWASRNDVSDAERAQAGWTEATVVSRFIVASTAFTRAILPSDRIVEGGRVYDIAGIKEHGLRGRLEITASARAD
ncbi:phage head completion protein [Paenirhodobacter enshiensis]|uniref:Phage head-tail adapter protein n=1 Tax=Paenirhodobacter enshiensis TaxID=1105367 RepID=A0A086XQM9_9RHOB|nr:head-tail adaptor protein [Paenirhodobacter enshiensis]KFI24329.1 hypothetical protein CG50_10805 [Paenirhodobacter enshiensis]